MSANLAVTIYALRRVLLHLSEVEQAKQPRYRTHNGAFQGRAAARVIIKRRLAVEEGEAAVLWAEAKEALLTFKGRPSIRGCLQRVKNELRLEHPCPRRAGFYAMLAARQALDLYPSLRDGRR
jgi:hypothetical protein